MPPLNLEDFNVNQCTRATTHNSIRDQWSQPKEVFSILLLVGGEVIARALAQLSGNGLTPVVFSFGWVAYSLSALIAAVGENKLMPTAPDCKCTVINGKTGMTLENSSWIIGRITRDFSFWSDPATKKKIQILLDAKWRQIKERDPTARRPTRAGLIASVYKPKKKNVAGTPRHDLIYWSGFMVGVLQIAIAAIPIALAGDWGILMITATGSCLALITGLLPQWRKEKWACRSHTDGTFVITKGIGSQHCIVILGNGHGLNLEDLAAGQNNLDATANGGTRATTLVLAVAWVLLLITAAGLQGSSWFLLAVGSIGIFQNVLVAGAARRPENFGIHLDFVEAIGDVKVMKTLFEVEKKYPGVGRSLRSEFFPGKLSEEEMRDWEELEITG